MRCTTRFAGMWCEPHETPGTQLTADVLGTLWCEQCDAQRSLINLGYAKGWPALALTVKNRHVTLPAGQEQYCKFARTFGHYLVSETLKKLERR